MRDAIVIAGLRTPFARLDGQLAALDAQTLGAVVVGALAERLGERVPIDDVLVASATAPAGNIARRILLDAGLPVGVPGITLDRQCGGGLDAVTLACRLVEAGAGECYVAAGVESASTSPVRAERGRDTGAGGRAFFPRRPFSAGEWDDPGMAETAEVIAADRAIDRERQDAYAAASHAGAVSARRDGVFDVEIIPCRSGAASVTQDSCPRETLTVDRLSRMRPVVRTGGSVTAGNASQIADGAAGVLVVSRRVRDLLTSGGLCHRDSVSVGLEPRLCGLGAIVATTRLQERNADLDPAEMDQVAMTEAFASQMVATIDALALDAARVNPHGGAIALGHPWGASGAAQVVRLHTDLRPGQQGLALAAVAGGMGSAAWFVAETA